MKTNDGRDGFISSSQQLVFGTDPNTGDLYSSDFAICLNGSLAVGGSAEWCSCPMGDHHAFFAGSLRSYGCTQITIRVTLITASMSVISSSSTAGASFTNSF